MGKSYSDLNTRRIEVFTLQQFKDNSKGEACVNTTLLIQPYLQEPQIQKEEMIGVKEIPIMPTEVDKRRYTLCFLLYKFNLTHKDTFIVNSSNTQDIHTRTRLSQRRQQVQYTTLPHYTLQSSNIIPQTVGLMHIKAKQYTWKDYFRHR